MIRQTLVGLSLLLAGPTMAQDRMTADVCTATWDRLMGYLPAAAPVAASVPRVTDDARCTVDSLEMDLAGTAGVLVEGLVWQMDDAARFVDQGLPPRQLQLTFGRLWPVANTADPVTNYLMRLQQADSGIQGDLTLRWDSLQNVLVLDRLELRIEPGNMIRLSGRFEGVDLTDMASIQTSTGSAGVAALDLTVQNHNLFQLYLSMPLGYQLLDPDGPPPEAQVAALIARAKTALETLPDETLPPRSREALVALLDEMPSPRGTLRLQVQSSPPFGAATLAPLALGAGDPDAAMLTVLEAVTIGANWTPEQTGESQ